MCGGRRRADDVRMRLRRARARTGCAAPTRAHGAQTNLLRTVMRVGEVIQRSTIELWVREGDDLLSTLLWPTRNAAREMPVARLERTVDEERMSTPGRQASVDGLTAGSNGPNKTRVYARRKCRVRQRNRHARVVRWAWLTQAARCSPLVKCSRRSVGVRHTTYADSAGVSAGAPFFLTVRDSE